MQYNQIFASMNILFEIYIYEKYIYEYIYEKIYIYIYKYVNIYI